MTNILIVDDDTTLCLMLKLRFTKNNFVADEAFSYADAEKKINKKKYDVVLTDLRLPDRSGLDILKLAKSVNSITQVIVMTGFAEIDSAVKAIKMGAYDYITKPINIDTLLGIINDSTKKTKVPFKYIVGSDVASTELDKMVKLVAPTMMSVLITGESGSGKEYIAKYIHSLSQRKDAPFVSIDCGTIPKDLAASELFGHKKGSFTGAVDDKIGYFELASGGTLFLDEIGNLSYDVQVQLLRALEERSVKPVGDLRTIKVDIRIIAATNADLTKLVAKGEFREDLYHRLNEFGLNALPLRQRKSDIEIFAKRFLLSANEELGKDVKDFDNRVKAVFTQYSWPGNLRELKNTIKRACLLCQGDIITINDIPKEMQTENKLYSDITPIKDSDSEAQLIIDALERTKHNRSKTAVLLNIDRKTLYNKMKKYGID